MTGGGGHHHLTGSGGTILFEQFTTRRRWCDRLLLLLASLFVLVLLEEYLRDHNVARAERLAGSFLHFLRRWCNRRCLVGVVAVARWR